MENPKNPPEETAGEIFSPVKDNPAPSAALLGDLQSLIESTRNRVAIGINAEMVLLYWDIGERIRKEILGDGRAAYGKQVVDMLSEQLSGRYGRGFARTNL